MAANIRLLATDLDGTVIESCSDISLYEDFHDKLLDLSGGRRVLWVACTGRGMSSFQSFFRPMQSMGVSPDYVIVHHAYIYILGKRGYLPHILWNLEIFFRIRISRWMTKVSIDEWHAMVTGIARGVITVAKRRNRLWLRFDSEESSVRAENILLEAVRNHEHLMVFRSGKDVDVRYVPSTKGLALRELSKRLNISPNDVLAIGNGHNDISMFVPSVAAQTGCPSNSEPRVMEAVHLAGGHIASKPALRGVIEILDAYQSGVVSSKLPENWEDLRKAEKMKSGRRSREGRRSKSSTNKIKGVWVMGAVIYAGLLVFASFNLLPYSNLIMKPYSKMLGWMMRIALKVLHVGGE